MHALLKRAAEIQGRTLTDFAYALVVDAKDDSAAAFYRHHEFIAFEANPRKLFLPLATVKGLL
ncbi:MAG TPA: DUF1778 domain-containing protein [Burkholderiaceae bacterium]|nr:DUF1778 domain-containing protein [Burkholderiaceae bacterium]